MIWDFLKSKLKFGKSDFIDPRAYVNMWVYTDIVAPSGNVSPLAAFALYRLTTDALTHTLPAAPPNGTWIEFQAGNVSAVLIQRGGSDTIVGSADPLQVDKPFAGSFRLVYNAGNWSFSGCG